MEALIWVALWVAVSFAITYIDYVHVEGYKMKRQDIPVMVPASVICAPFILYEWAKKALEWMKS